MQDLRERLEMAKGHAAALERDNDRLRDKLQELRRQIEELTKPARSAPDVWAKPKRLHMRGVP